MSTIDCEIEQHPSPAFEVTHDGQEQTDVPADAEQQDDQHQSQEVDQQRELKQDHQQHAYEQVDQSPESQQDGVQLEHHTEEQPRQPHQDDVAPKDGLENHREPQIALPMHDGEPRCELGQLIKPSVASCDEMPGNPSGSPTHLLPNDRDENEKTTEFTCAEADLIHQDTLSVSPVNHDAVSDDADEDDDDEDDGDDAQKSDDISRKSSVSSHASDWPSDHSYEAPTSVDASSEKSTPPPVADIDASSDSTPEHPIAELRSSSPNGVTIERLTSDSSSLALSSTTTTPRTFQHQLSVPGTGVRLTRSSRFGAPNVMSTLEVPHVNRPMSRAKSIEKDDSFCPAAWMSPPQNVTNDCIWQAMKPGYTMQRSRSSSSGRGGSSDGGGSDQERGKSAVVIKHMVEVERVSEEVDGTLKLAIPVMTKSLAIFCLLLNFMSPGLGTFVSGMSVLCGSRPRRFDVDKSSLIWLNIWVALLQLITTPLFLLGWVWSIAWGFAFVRISNQYHSLERQENEEDDDNTFGRRSSAELVRVRGQSRSGGVASGANRSAASTPASSSTTRTTTTTTTLSVSNIGIGSVDAPIIVLHEAPIIVRRAAGDGTDGGYNWRLSSSHVDGTLGGGSVSAANNAVDLMASNALNRQNRMHGVGGRARASRNGAGGSRAAARRRSSTCYPEMLLIPGALETIVMNNGAFLTSSSTPSVSPGHSRVDRSAGGARGTRSSAQEGSSSRRAVGGTNGSSGTGSNTALGDHTCKTEMRTLQMTTHR